MQKIAALAAIYLTITVSPASADVYRYLAEDGSLCFTDAPVSKNAELVVKERKPGKLNRKSARLPGHLAATGINVNSTNSQPSLKETHVDSPAGLPLQGRVTSSTGLRVDPIDGRLRNHNGVDIAVPVGTPVKPVAPGVVAFSGARPGYGTMVVIDHNNGLVTLYAHHSTNLVSEGEQVDQQTHIALSGSSGRSTGPHLHFEAWQDGVNVTERYQSGDVQPMSASRRSEPIRRVVQSDGSILFTNLPLYHP